MNVVAALRQGTRVLAVVDREPVKAEVLKVVGSPQGVEIHLRSDGNDRVVSPSVIQSIEAQPEFRYGRRGPESDVVNTTKLYNEFPALGLLGMMDARSRGKDPSSFIEDMEREGAEQLAASSKLPTKGSDAPEWKEMGVIFGEVDPKDPLFREVRLPEGWRVMRTNHSMWNELRDGLGRVRAKMFYKAAFYDRSAHVHLNQRYYVKRQYKDENSSEFRQPTRYVVMDEVTQQPIFETEFHDYVSPDARPPGVSSESDYEEALAWLKTNRPDWENAAAYWGWD